MAATTTDLPGSIPTFQPDHAQPSSREPTPSKSTQQGSEMTLAQGADIDEKSPPSPENDESHESAVPPQANNPLQRVASQSVRMGKKKVIVVMLALCMALFLAALDMTIISTALPTIAGTFEVSESGYTWMASSYLLANAACLPVWGKISDIWGRKLIILIANVLFLVGSLVCALAGDLPMFLGGRVVQGVGGGGIHILCQISVSDLFSARERPVYYAMFGAVWAIAGSLGPVIGGALTQRVTWRWCFYLNLPVGGVSLAILVLFLQIESPKTPLLAGLRAIDWLGTICIIGGTVMFLFGLEFGGISYPWNSATIICLIIFGVVVLCIFGIVERRVAKYPIMPTALFRDLSNVCLLGCTWAHASVFIASSYYLPIYFQAILGVGPIMSGVYLLPQVVGLAVCSMLTGIVIRKTGRYLEVIRAGMILMTLGVGLFNGLKPYKSWPRIIIFQLILGIGVGPNFQSPLVAIQSSMRPAEVATATSTFGFIRQLSTSASLVFGGVVYQNVLRKAAPTLYETLGPELAPSFLETIAGSNIAKMPLLTDQQREVVIHVYMHSLSRMWIFYTCIAGIGILLSLFVKKRELSKHHELTKTGLAAQEQARLERLAEEKERKSGKKNSNDNSSNKV
ncbi:hypothetical protein VTO42DRAFT_3468 [Malbranchea cinnamomea]